MNQFNTLSLNMFLVVVNDVFDELKEENNRLINELLFADKYLKNLIKFKSFVEKISYLFEYNLEENDKKEYKELIRSVDEVYNGLETRTYIQSQSVLLFNPFVCDLCNKRFKNQNRLSKHLKDVHKEKVTNDIEGNNWLKRSDSLHIETKTEPNEEMKDMRDRALTANNAITDPIRNKNRIAALKRAKDRRDRQEVYACHQPNCDRVFHYPWHLANHQRSHIPRQVKVCPICQKKFSCHSVLDIHISSHDTIGRFQCTVIGCEKRFKHKTALKYHMERIHGNKGFPCDWPGCKFKGSHINRLVEHQTSVHSEERNKPCDWPGCDAKFKTRTQLYNHTKIHKGDKRFQCNWPGCDYRTIFAQNLKGHMICHCDELKFECDWPECGKKFKTKRYLKNHVKNAHKLSKNLIYNIGIDNKN